MSPTATSYVGADVAQDTIAFCGPTAATIKNEPQALRAYLGTLPAERTWYVKPPAGTTTPCTKPVRSWRGR